MRPIAICGALILAWLVGPASAQTPPAAPARTDAISLMGTPALPPGFKAFPYVNPNAPKGGHVTLSVVGGFDSFNPFIIRGTPAAGLPLVWDTLLTPSDNEPSTAYADLARSVSVSPDGRTVTFVLHKRARFNDGTPVTAADVAWTFNMLRAHGQPLYASYYAAVRSVSVQGEQTVVFHLRAGANRELPLILGQLQVLPEHWWKGRDFSAPLTVPPLGSGPYRIESFALGRSVTYARVKNYWARNLPSAKGLYNFGHIRYEYFRDPTVALQAFKAGQIDFRQENIAKNWATAYNFPAVKRGLVKLWAVRHHLPTGMQGFAMNTRRAVFHDPRVREAMVLAFDFQWMNKTLFYGSYTRTQSYFSNSDLASSGIPKGVELALLKPYRSQLPPALFTKPYTLPVTSGSGNNNKELLRAYRLLQAAGWRVKNRKLVNAAGRQMSFEILLDDPAFTRVALPYVQTLKHLGIAVKVRLIDPAQYQHRMDAFDYDMTVGLFGESDSPGNEQRNFWTCRAAKTDGSQNLMGICSPVVDALVNRVINAPNRPALLAATHALDRVLLWGWYIVPQWHLDKFWLAYWNIFGHPKMPIRNGFDINDWWVDPALAARTNAARHSGG